MIYAVSALSTLSAILAILCIVLGLRVSATKHEAMMKQIDLEGQIDHHKYRAENYRDRWMAAEDAIQGLEAAPSQEEVDAALRSIRGVDL